MLDYVGGDIGQIMADESQHVHSRSAYDMMEEYKIGELGGDEKIVSEGMSLSSRQRMALTKQTGSREKTSILTRRMLWPITTATSSSISVNHY
jgi:hypothetical protein